MTSTVRYVDATTFEEIVRKELNDLASADEEHILWQNQFSVSRWKDILEAMETKANELTTKWEEEYKKEQRTYTNAGIYKLPEWNLFCKNHELRMSELRKRLKQIKERKARIWQFFNDAKENELLSVVAPFASQEDVQAALQKLQERQEKLLEYQGKQTAYTENWGYGYRHGGQTTTLQIIELWKLGYSPNEALSIMREYMKEWITPWIPYCRGYHAEPLPDFHAFLYEKGYHAGPAK